MPATLYGHVVLGMIGDYCPLAGMYKPRPFWQQDDTQTVRSLKDSLSRLQAAEKGSHHWYSFDINPHANNALLPWIDYQYTSRRKLHRPESAELMRRYLELVKPLIVATFERKTSGVVRANFVGLWSAHDFIPQVGDVQIQYWTHPGTVTGAGSKAKAGEIEPDPEECFIQVPCIHPGAEKYDKRSTESRRVCDITMWQVVLLTDIALEILSKGWSGNREDLCDLILQTFNARWEKAGCDKILKKAKADLQNYNSNKTTQWSKDQRRAFRSQLDGKEIPVNASGIATLYWTKPDGKTSRITVSGGRATNLRVPKDATGDAAVRTVHL